MGMRQLQLQCVGICAEVTPHNQPTPNHVLHLVLTVLTAGVWVIPWIALAAGDAKATCVRCGTARHPQSLLALPGVTPQIATDRLAELDETLRKIKGPLRTCRAKHGISGDVIFRLRYDPGGNVQAVTIDSGPPNMTPSFITDTTTIIRGMVTLPQTAQGGVLNFTDLGDEAGPYR